jgi:hypothetical protein
MGYLYGSFLSFQLFFHPALLFSNPHSPHGYLDIAAKNPEGFQQKLAIALASKEDDLVSGLKDLLQLPGDIPGLGPVLVHTHLVQG